MRIASTRVPHLSWTVAVALVISQAASPLVAQQTDPKAGEQASMGGAAPRSAQADANNLPDSPGAVVAQAQQPSSGNSPETQQAAQQGSSTSQQNQPQQNQPQQTAPPQVQSQQNPAEPSNTISPQKPVGTAAAEAPNASGIAASQPAGVAIAPAKQHRVRTIVLRTGAIVGACVAVGAVVALTAATPSKPPGAH